MSISMASQWALVQARLSDAAAAKAIMGSRAADAKDRDLATDRYVTAVDALVADLLAAGLADHIAFMLGAAPSRGRGPGI